MSAKSRVTGDQPTRHDLAKQIAENFKESREENGDDSMSNEARELLETDNGNLNETA